MSRAISTAVLAAVIGLGGIGSMTYADHPDDDRRSDRLRDRDERREDRRVDRDRDGRGSPQYTKALRELQDAREILVLAEGSWDGRRQQTLTQVNYAIEQVYAAMGDDAGKARDQENYRRLRDRRGDRDLDNRPRRNMNAAMDHLQAARDAVRNAGGDENRRQKTLEFIDQAIKDIRLAQDPDRR